MGVFINSNRPGGWETAPPPRAGDWSSNVRGKGGKAISSEPDVAIPSSRWLRLTMSEAVVEASSSRTGLCWWYNSHLTEKRCKRKLLCSVGIGSGAGDCPTDHHLAGSWRCNIPFVVYFQPAFQYCFDKPFIHPQKIRGYSLQGLSSLLPLPLHAENGSIAWRTWSKR